MTDSTLVTEGIVIDSNAPDDHWVSPSGSDCWCKVGQLKQLIVEHKRMRSTLEATGYTDNGGELWKPPVGKRPDFELIDSLRSELAELKSEAEKTLEYYAEKGRVVVAVDGNPVQRLSASAEIAISKAEAERDKMADRACDWQEVGERAIERARQAEKERDEAREGLKAVEALIDESNGVYGLHLNGDLAPWEDLRTGGRFEDWLITFDKALVTQSSTPTKEGEK